MLSVLKLCFLFSVSGNKSSDPGTPESTRRVHSGPKERTPIPVEERGEGDGIEAPPHRAPSSAAVRSPPSRLATLYLYRWGRYGSHIY